MFACSVVLVVVVVVVLMINNDHIVHDHKKWINDYFSTFILKKFKTITVNVSI